MTFAIVESSSGRRVGRRDEARDRLGRRRQDEQPAGDGVDRMEPVPEPRDDAEVAAAAADRPEQVRVRVGVGAHELAVRGHDVGREQVVDREPVLAHEVADAAAEGEAADADGAGVAEADAEPVLRGRDGDLAGRRAGLGPGRARVGVDLDGLQQREVENDPALADAVAGAAVAAAAHGQLQAVLAGQPDDGRDLGGVGRPDDHRRPAVDERQEDRAGGVVVLVAGCDHLPGEVGAQALDRKLGMLGHHTSPRSRVQGERPAGAAKLSGRPTRSARRGRRAAGRGR